MSFIDNVIYRSLDGLQYAIREAGPRQSRPVFLLHGLLDTGASFAPLVEAMQTLDDRRYHFLAPDWRGHGHTAWAAGDYWFPRYLADLEALIRATGDARPAILIGHSMGGQVASQFAGLRPQAISHLITLDSLNVPDAEPATAPDRYRRWLDARRMAPQSRVYDSLDMVVGRIARRYPELSAVQQRDLARQWSLPHDASGRRRMHFDPWHRISFPYGFRAAESMAMWRQVTAPVLCIDGGRSPARHYVPPDEMARRHACFSHLRHRVIEGCGHMLHIQNPTAIAAEICSFLDTPSDT